MNQQPVSPRGAPIHSTHQLPVHPPDRLFGRDSDLASIHPLLQAGSAILLHGPAGVGKTALAATLASTFAGQSGGVLWFDIRRDSLRSLLIRFARAFGADLTLDPAEFLPALLHQNRPLIVLDGPLADDTAREFVLSYANGIPLLLTSERLIPGPWVPHALTDLDAESARAMLLHLAGQEASMSGGDITPLSEALFGHPFSIAVAAHQLQTAKVSPSDFLSRMPEMPPGDTNRAMGVLVAAYRLLPPPLQGMVLLVGTSLGGGAGEELLTEVGGAPAAVIRAALHQLVARGLVTGRTLNGQPYYAVHDLVQAFAHAFLRGKNQLETMQTRHLRSVVTVVRRHFAETASDHLLRLEAEMPSVLAASLYAAENGQLEQLQTLVQLLTPSSAESFVPVYGYQPELEWLKALVENPMLAQYGVLGLPAPAPVGEPPSLPEPIITQEAAPVESVEPTSGVIETDVQEQDTTFAEPIQAFEEEVALEPESPPAAPDQPAAAEEAIPIHERARRAAELGQTDEAIRYYTQAIEAYHADGKIDDELAALEALAELNLQQENIPGVLNYVDRGMQLAQQVNNPQREGHMLILLGDLQVMLGRDTGAESAYQEAILALRPTESWFEIGTVLDKLGALYLDQERYQDAADVLEQGIPIFQRVQRPDYLMGVLDKLGDAFVGLQHWDKAVDMRRRTLELARQSGDPFKHYHHLNRLGETLEASGKRDEALTVYRAALQLAFELDDPDLQGMMLLVVGQLLLDDQAQLSRAVQLLEGAIQRQPDNTDAQRLLGRAKTRLQRLTQAGVTLAEANDSIEDYARAAADPMAE